MAEPWGVTDKMVAYLIERADALAAHGDNPRELLTHRHAITWVPVDVTMR